MTPPRILIAGIGNIFFGDDAFGVEVARRLLAMPLREDVRVVDFGIRGLDLTYSLLEPYETVILVDAMPRGGAPGTLYLLEPLLAELDAPEPACVDPHALDPVKVLRAARSMGSTIESIFIVGCEPFPIDPDADLGMELSHAVHAALEPALDMIQRLVERLPEPGPAATSSEFDTVSRSAEGLVS